MTGFGKILLIGAALILGAALAIGKEEMAVCLLVLVAGILTDEICLALRKR